MSRVDLSPTTERLVERLFAADVRASVAAKLEAACGSGLPLWPDPSPVSLERVRFAVIKLSGGSEAELSRAIAVANTDWRDVLVAAGFGHDVLAHQKWAHEQLGA